MNSSNFDHPGYFTCNKNRAGFIIDNTEKSEAGISQKTILDYQVRNDQK